MQVKKRPLSISSLSSMSSTSPQRVQHKRPNLSQDGEESCSDLPSHTSSDSNLAGPASDRLSLTSDRVSLTSDSVGMTSDRVSLTSDPVSMTCDSVSLTSMDDSGLTPTTASSKQAALATEGQEADSAVEEAGCLKGPQPALEDRPAVPSDTRCGGQVEPSGPSSKSSCVGVNGRSSCSGSLCTSPTPQQHSLGMAAASATAGSRSNSQHTTHSSSPFPGGDACSGTSVQQTTPPSQPSRGDNVSDGTSIHQTTPPSESSLDDAANHGTSVHETTPPSPSSGISCVDEVSGRQPVVIKPLQTSIRPVRITIPDSIRKPRTSSSSLEGEKATGESLACGQQASRDSGPSCRKSIGGSATLTPPSALKGAASSSGVSPAASPASSVAARPVLSLVSARNGANAGSWATGAKSSVATSGSVSPLAVSGTVSPLAVSGTVSPLALSGTVSPLTVSGTVSPLAVSGTVSPLALSAGRRVHPVPLVTGAVPLAGAQMQKVGQQSCSSPLSPTAMARRRFLASHFDMPDMPVEEPTEDSSAQNRTMETSLASVDSNSDSLSSGRSSLLAVPSSLSFRSKGDASPMSSPSDSPGSALQSPSADLPDEATGRTLRSSAGDLPNEITGRAPQVPPDDSSNGPPSPVQSLPTGQSASIPTSSTSPPSRGRSQRKAEGGGISGRSGSGKTGSYVAYAQRVVTELVDTERLYISSLEAIIKVSVCLSS